MRLATVTAATALSLGTVSIPTVGIADWRGDQFGHRHFHNHKTLVLPYAYDCEADRRLRIRGVQETIRLAGFTRLAWQT